MARANKNNNNNLSLVKHEDFWGHNYPFSLLFVQCKLLSCTRHEEETDMNDHLTKTIKKGGVTCR